MFGCRRFLALPHSASPAIPKKGVPSIDRFHSLVARFVQAKLFDIELQQQVQRLTSTEQIKDLQTSCAGPTARPTSRRHCRPYVHDHGRLPQSARGSVIPAWGAISLLACQSVTDASRQCYPRLDSQWSSDPRSKRAMTVHDPRQYPGNSCKGLCGIQNSAGYSCMNPYANCGRHFDLLNFRKPAYTGAQQIAIGVLFAFGALASNF